MSAIKVLEKLISTAIGITSILGDRIRHGKYESKPGELVEKLSSDERESLQKLTIEDLETLQPTPGRVSYFTENETWASQEKQVDEELRKNKLEFDKILNLPSERKKRYES